MRGMRMYKRIGGGFCALLLSLSLAGCDAPVDVGVGSGGPSQIEDNASSLSEESSGAPVEKKPESRPETGSSSAQSRPQESSRTHQEKPGHHQEAASQQGSAASGEAELLTEAQAKERALAHAQLSAGEVTFTKVKLDWEDGRQVYEIEFVTGDRVEYDYEIDALNGEVLSWERENAPAAATARPTPKPTPQPTPEPTQAPAPEPVGISPEEARSIALARVPGAAAGDIVKFETDYEDGRTVYEGEIVFGGMEYEFEIDGTTGAVLDWDVEVLDD